MQQSAAVWIDDSHAIFRRGLSACLSTEGFVVRGESIRFAPLPVLTGIKIIIFESAGTTMRQAVRMTEGKDIRLVATVHEAREDEVYRLLEVGVAAVLPHAELTCETLINTIRAVLSGVTAMPTDVMPRLLQHARTSGQNLGGGLSDREREVLKWLAEGSDTQEIATGLCFSERTVKNVVHDILMKLNCRTRAHAVATATRSGVI